MLDANAREEAAGIESGATRDAPVPRVPARRPMLFSLIVASALSPLAINIFLPSMNSIAGDLDAGSAAVGLGLSLYLAALAVLQLVAGPLSDRYGRRPIMLAGIALFIVGTALCLLATTIELFLVGRVVQAASVTGVVLSRAIVRDIYSRERSAAMLGYVTMGLAVAPMVGPAIGGLIDSAFGWRAVFWLLGGTGVLTLLLLIVDLSETNASRGAPMAAQFRAYRTLLSHGPFWAYAGVIAFTASIFFAFLGFAPLFSTRVLGMSPAGYGLWFMLCSVGYILGNFATARLSERLGLGPLMIAGAAISLLAGIVTLAAFSLGVLTPLTLFGPMMLVGLGNGLSLPTATAGGVSLRPEAAGAASGLLGAMQIGMGAVASVLTAALVGSPVIVAALMTAFGVAGVVFAFRVPKERTA